MTVAKVIKFKSTYFKNIEPTEQKGLFIDEFSIFVRNKNAYCYEYCIQ